jgi:hypothetical protein
LPIKSPVNVSIVPRLKIAPPLTKELEEIA